ncbi:uncharacterized protein LOC115214308 isoform X2 [Argonauta hians]
MECSDNLSQTFHEGLKNVFQKILIRQKPITDDTSLQKLCDFIPEFVNTVEAVKLCWADGFLQALITEQNISNASLLFGTQISCCLVHNEVIFTQYKTLFCEFYRSIFSSSYWSTSISLKTAMFTALRKTIQHIPGFTSVTLTFPDTPDKALDVISKESSLFLTKEASKFLTQFLVQCFQISDVSPELLKTRENLLEIFWDYICHSSLKGLHTKSEHSKELVFFILKDVGAVSKDIWVWITKHKDCFSELHQLIISSQSWDVAMELYFCLLLSLPLPKDERISKVLKLFQQIASLEDDNKLREFVEKLLRSFLSSCPGDELFSQLMETFYQPKLKIFNYITSSTGGSEQISLNDINPPECEARLCYTIECSEKLLDSQLLQKESIKTTLELATTCFLKFFQKTTDTEMLQTSKYYQFFKVISNSTKLLLKMLHYFHKLAGYKSEFLLSQENHVILANILMNIIEKIGQNVLVVSQSFDCLWLFLLPVLELSDISSDSTDDTSNIISNSAAKDTSNRVSNVIKYCLCHPQWEIRDSAMEFLNKCYTASKTPVLSSWILENKLHSLAYHSLSDGESYVRASCIAALLTLLNIDYLWTNFLSSVEKSQVDIQQDIVNVLETDTEAFPRRAAAKFVLKLSTSLHCSDSMVTLQNSVMEKVLQDDLDWEVKKIAIEYWENIMSSEKLSATKNSNSLPSYAVGLLKAEDKCDACTYCKMLKFICKLHNNNCIDSLLLAYHDCDYSVQEEAGKVLVNLKTFLVDHFKLENDGSCLAKKEDINSQDLYLCCKKNCCSSEQSTKKAVSFVKMLSDLDVSSYLQDCLRNCDLYIKNPLSLIEDILADCNGYVTSDEDDENTLDCY